MGCEWTAHLVPRAAARMLWVSLSSRGLGALGGIFSLHSNGSPTCGAQEPFGAGAEGQDLGKDAFLPPW